MKASLLPIAYANTGYELESMLPVVLERGLDFNEACEVSSMYRQLGVGDLLLSADPTGFYESLFKAGRVLLHVLHASVPGVLTSRCHGFVDAMACRDKAGAEAIAELAPSEPDLQREYEEDFLYVRILMELYMGSSSDEVNALVARYEALAEDEPDFKWPVLKAIASRVQPDFDDALDAWIESIVESTEAAAEADQLDPDAAATTAHVSVDVLTAIELAERAGLNLAHEYRLAPSVARAFGRVAPPPPDSWQTIEGFA